jgi:prolyl oligopeptidase
MVGSIWFCQLELGVNLSTNSTIVISQQHCQKVFEDTTREVLPFQKLVNNFEAQYQLVANDGPIFTFLTNKDAPRYKLNRVDLNAPGNWIDVIPESKTDVLSTVHCINGQQLLLCSISDVKHLLQIHDLETGILQHRIPLEIGTVIDISAKRKESEFFFNFTSFLTPGTVYHCDLRVAKEEPKVKVLREVGGNIFDCTAFETQQVFVTSNDGTKIPMFIVTQRGLVLDGNHPALLYGTALQVSGWKPINFSCPLLALQQFSSNFHVFHTYEDLT